MAPNGRQGPRADYHYGDLRETLIQAAMSMIAARGLAGFALSELARAVGVSGAAPYRYVLDRTAMIAEVVQRGFQQLTADLDAARQAGGMDPIDALERCAQAHLAFAARKPAVYAAMFEASLPVDEHQGLTQAREMAFAVLRKAAQNAVSRGTAPSRPPAQMVALHVWSLTHGIASLVVSYKNDSDRVLPTAPEELLEAGVMIYLQSLGLVSAAYLTETCVSFATANRLEVSKAI